MECLTLRELLEAELNKLNLEELSPEGISWSSLFDHEHGHLKLVIIKHDKHENLVSIYARYALHNNKYACSVVLDYKAFPDKQSFISFAVDEIYAQTEMKLKHSPEFESYLDDYTAL